MHIVLYASAHGLGHMVRLAEVGRALLDLKPDCRLTFRGRVRENLIAARVPGPFDLLPGEVDAGLVETDLATQDIAATARRGEVVLEKWEEIRAGEVELLKRIRATAAVCDLPGIPLEAARELNIPGIAIGNFSWDWVYQAYHERLENPLFGRLAERFRRAYGAATTLAQIPVGPPMTAFPEVRRVGLVGRRGSEDEAEAIRETYGIASPSAFLAVGKLTSRETLSSGIRGANAYRFFGFLDLGEDLKNYARMDDSEQRRFPELLRTADVVLTTLGHSIFSEAVINETPIVTPPRLEYPEYDVLLAQGRKCHPIVEIGLDEYRAGRWSASLDRAQEITPSEPRSAIDGATRIAEIILALS